MAYNYTDLTITMIIDPQWLADCDSVWVSIESIGGNVIDVQTTSFNPDSGTIVATFPQAEMAKVSGSAYVQCNGFLNGGRWASEKKKVFIGTNTIRRLLNE